MRVTMIELPTTGLLGLQHYFGTEEASGEPSRTIEERKGRCYELVSYALAFGTAPRGSLAVHGSWHGPRAPQRIGHAWLLLPRGANGTFAVWEPICAAIFPLPDFKQAARAWEEVRYTREQVRLNIAASGHYGRWHDSRYP